MFKRRRSSSGISDSKSNNCGESNSNSCMNSPKCNNAFLHGTGWSPLNKTSNSNTVKTPNKLIGGTVKPTVVCTSVPMTPLTLSQSSFKTPQKHHEQDNGITSSAATATVLTPKVVSTNSPYTSLNLKNSPSESLTSSASATFWSYPNLSLSQMGLDAEPPLPIEPSNPNTFYNIFNCDPHEDPAINNKLPELFHETATCNSTEKEMIRMSPLSWLLSVSSQDTSLGIFDQSQQILTEYLSLQQYQP